MSSNFSVFSPCAAVGSCGDSRTSLNAGESMSRKSEPPVRIRAFWSDSITSIFFETSCGNAGRFCSTWQINDLWYNKFSSIFEGASSGHSVWLAIILIVVDSILHTICSSPVTMSDILTSLRKVMRMLTNKFLITMHAVIASIAASLLLPQEY